MAARGTVFRGGCALKTSANAVLEHANGTDVRGFPSRRTPESVQLMSSRDEQGFNTRTRLNTLKHWQRRYVDLLCFLG